MKNIVFGLFLALTSAAPALADDFTVANVRTRMVNSCSSYMFSMEARGYVCSSPSFINIVDEFSLNMALTQIENRLAALEARANKLEQENSILRALLNQ